MEGSKNSSREGAELVPPTTEGCRLMVAGFQVCFGTSASSTPPLQTV